MHHDKCKYQTTEKYVQMGIFQVFILTGTLLIACNRLTFLARLLCTTYERFEWSGRNAVLGMYVWLIEMNKYEFIHGLNSSRRMNGFPSHIHTGGNHIQYSKRNGTFNWRMGTPKWNFHNEARPESHRILIKVNSCLCVLCVCKPMQMLGNIFSSLFTEQSVNTESGRTDAYSSWG